MSRTLPRLALQVFVAAIVLTFALGLAMRVAWSYDDGGDYGNGNDQRRCHQSENCRGSFSPGPFDRSPVEISGNTVCMPGATCYAQPPPSSNRP